MNFCKPQVLSGYRGCEVYNNKFFLKLIILTSLLKIKINFKFLFLLLGLTVENLKILENKNF